MAGRIPRQFIDDLIARTDIVELIDSRVRLKKAGRNYQACCPFHNEKTPSFSVSQEKQFYHCFGCGVSGNAISFLLEYDRLEFPEAVEELARFHGLDVPREQSSRPEKSKEQKAQIASDYELMEQVARYFQQQLKTNSDKHIAIDYLKGRGLSGEVVKDFAIGLAPNGWDGVLSMFGKSPEAKQQLLDLKLVNQNDSGRTYDFFRERIMFPIRDKRGRVIAFGGRVMGDGGPKYLNSPETRIFHKGNELYGFYQARQANRNLDQVLIVEGYMDVVALAQFGINYAVASLGTATTPEHIQMLTRATPKIICCYDGDRAGREAAWRALENALAYLKDGVEMKFLFLPDGEDPDTMVRKVGKEAFEEILQKATPLSTFFFDNLLQKHHVGSTEGKAALKAIAEPMIQSIAGENQQALLTDELNKLLGVTVAARLQKDIEQANRRGNMKKKDHSKNNKQKVTPIRMLMKLLLEKPSLASQCPDVTPAALAGMPIAGLDVLIDIHRFCADAPNATTPTVLEAFRDHPQFANLSKLLMTEDVQQNDSKIYRDSFAKLIDWQIQSRIDQLLSKSRISPLSKDEKMEMMMLTKEQS